MNPLYAKLTPEQRLTNVGLMNQPLLTVYATPTEAQTDIRSICVTLSQLRGELDGMHRRLRQIANSGDCISAEVAAVINRYSLILRSPEAPGIREQTNERKP